jgi:hypothetical protein
VQLKIYAGPPGSVVTFVGSGFLPGEVINVISDRSGSTVIHTFMADTKGSFSNAGYTVPAGSAEGQMTFTITGNQSGSSGQITYYVTGN